MDERSKDSRRTCFRSPRWKGAGNPGDIHDGFVRLTEEARQGALMKFLASNHTSSHVVQGQIGLNLVRTDREDVRIRIYVRTGM